MHAYIHSTHLLAAPTPFELLDSLTFSLSSQSLSNYTTLFHGFCLCSFALCAPSPSHFAPHYYQYAAARSIDLHAWRREKERNQQKTTSASFEWLNKRKPIVRFDHLLYSSTFYPPRPSQLDLSRERKEWRPRARRRPDHYSLRVLRLACLVVLRVHLLFDGASAASSIEISYIGRSRE